MYKNRRNYKEFTSIGGRTLAAWNTGDHQPALGINDLPNIVLDEDQAHALIRHLIEISGEPPVVSKLTYADLEPGTEFQFDIDDPEAQDSTPVYLKINDEVLRNIRYRKNYAVKTDLNREVVVIHD